jgi:hypothetical protein
LNWCTGLAGGFWSSSTSTCFLAITPVGTWENGMAACIAYAGIPSEYHGRLAHIVDATSASAAVSAQNGGTNGQTLFHLPMHLPKSLFS